MVALSSVVTVAIAGNCKVLQEMANFSRFSVVSQIKVQYGHRKLQFHPEDITVSSISRIFHLIPETIVLISEEGTVCVPDSAGKFEVNEFLEYKVEGDVSTIGTSGMTSLQISEQPSTSGASNTSRWKPKAFPLKLKVPPVSDNLCKSHGSYCTCKDFVASFPGSPIYQCTRALKRSESLGTRLGIWDIFHACHY